MTKIVTTSWDDGSPHDIKMAELLVKYNLQGTFYVPKINPENEVMDERHLRMLSGHFEIGGHTMNHISLKKAKGEKILYEVNGAFEWLTQLTGSKPVSFCLPFGHWSDESVQIIYKTGFRYVRTTGLLSTDCSTSFADTTVQVYEHKKSTYLAHLLKHRKFSNLKLWLKGRCPYDLLKIIDYYINHIDRNGGCFHIWGHSWEIEKLNLWHKLESIFSHISSLQGFSYIQNKDILKFENCK
jgi:peptidoglycan/xylan/chitin deacetylase (PgdA/CDA1 family)